VPPPVGLWRTGSRYASAAGGDPHPA